MKKKTLILATAIVAALSACNQKKASDAPATEVATADTTLSLPAPYATKSTVKFSNVVGWPDGKTPQAPAGFTVTEFARDLTSPRWIYAAPNGDIFVA